MTSQLSNFLLIVSLVEGGAFNMFHISEEKISSSTEGQKKLPRGKDPRTGFTELMTGWLHLLLLAPDTWSSPTSGDPSKNPFSGLNWQGRGCSDLLSSLEVIGRTCLAGQ